MISNRTSRVFHPNERGFTLVEAIFTLLLLGLLTTGAATYYFDNEREAEERFAKATVDEAQVRINTRFTSALTQGKPCDVAVNAVDTLAELADDAKTKRFGSFILSADKEPISESGTAVTAMGVDSKRVYTNAGSLKVPSCTQLALNISPNGGLEGNAGFEEKPGQIVDESGACNPELFPCGLSKIFHDFVVNEMEGNASWGSFLNAGTIDSLYPDSALLGNLTRDLERKFDEYIKTSPYADRGFQLSGKLWSIQHVIKFIPYENYYRVIVSNIDKTLADEFYQTQDWVECEMYSPKTNVEWGKTVVSEKEFPRRYYVLDMDKLQSF